MDKEAQRKAAEERHKQYATAEIHEDGINQIISGYARVAQEAGNGDGYFCCPLISLMKAGLWQGGCRNGVKLPGDFDFVLSLYRWEQYSLDPETQQRLEVEMYDAGAVPDVKQLYELRDLAYERWVSGQKILIHCQAGLNRSGLLTALVLMKAGYDADTAIATMRMKRSPMVLCNTYFENWLLNDAQG